MNTGLKTPEEITRIITLEEHFATPAFMEGPGSYLDWQQQPARIREQVCDLGDQRIADMDAAGIDIQVLSLNYPGVEHLDSAKAVAFARDTNNSLAEAVGLHRDRFAAFASIPTSVPDAAADELERVVHEHGFVGAMINGHYRGRYLDDEFFWPILERAEKLQVPLYIHPGRPPQSVVDTYYSGNFTKEVTEKLALAGWGWHIETAVHILRIILSGAFDKYPRLQVIIGHLGEGLPFMMPRIDRLMPMELTKLNRPMGAYFRENLHYTVSGFNFIPPFLDLLFEVGVSRIMFSADYPYGSLSEARAFLDKLPVSPADRQSIAHRNAEILLGL